MKLVDANLLLYAINESGPHHEASKAWLESAFVDGEPLAFSWIVLRAFLRTSTHARVFENPLTAEQATEIIEGWLAHPNATTVTPGPEHWTNMKRLLGAVGTAGNLASDVHLACLAIENGAVVYSADHDFARFEGVRHVNPLRDG